MQKEERREKPIARMEKGINGKTRLMVDGKPFFVLGGEIHNSTASGEAYMEEYVWKQLPGKQLNTLLVPICWELVEKEQGRLDFAIPRRVIDRARQEGIRLIFLWFGLWKNGASHYAPAWVLKESGTYFRARGRDRLPSSTISPLCEIAVEADARAFSAFMAFLREYDQEERTVIMVQVENEVGFLGGNRDYSEAAVEAYAKEVPPELAEAFGVEAAGSRHLERGRRIISWLGISLGLWSGSQLGGKRSTRFPCMRTYGWRLFLTGLEIIPPEGLQPA